MYLAAILGLFKALLVSYSMPETNCKNLQVSVEGTYTLHT